MRKPVYYHRAYTDHGSAVVIRRGHSGYDPGEFRGPIGWWVRAWQAIGRLAFQLAYRRLSQRPMKR